MNQKILAVLISSALCFTGCSSNPKKNNSASDTFLNAGIGALVLGGLALAAKGGDEDDPEQEDDKENLEKIVGGLLIAGLLIHIITDDKDDNTSSSKNKNRELTLKEIYSKKVNQLPGCKVRRLNNTGSDWLVMKARAECRHDNYYVNKVHEIKTRNKYTGENNTNPAHNEFYSIKSSNALLSSLDSTPTFKENKGFIKLSVEQARCNPGARKALYLGSMCGAAKKNPNFVSIDTMNKFCIEGEKGRKVASYSFGKEVIFIPKEIGEHIVAHRDDTSRALREAEKLPSDCKQ